MTRPLQEYHPSPCLSVPPPAGMCFTSTPLHSKGWTEEQAVEYFDANSAVPLAAIRSEVQRYLVMPGQATAYKIGMIKIMDLRAKAENAVLLIDEADSFLQDRQRAHHSWEISHVNELLTQMEAFDGIFIASTNLIDSLDAASLRRFDFKVKFDYLTREQRRAMLLRIAADANEPLEQPHQALEAIDRLEHITPGDFANVLRQLRVTGLAASATNVVALLEEEAAMKPEGRRRMIGFTANG